MPKQIIIFRIDFDGCLHNAAYENSSLENPVTETNPLLIKHILDELATGLYDHAYFEPGSLRQSGDSQKFMHHGQWRSYFKTMVELVNAIKTQTTVPCEAGGFVLADEGNKNRGTFDNVVNDRDENYYSACWDDSKRMIVYAGFHLRATLHEDAIIHMHFIDDLEWILQGLLNFYHTHSRFLPRAGNLRAFCYNGQTLTRVQHESKDEVIGDGVPDIYFDTNLSIMRKHLVHENRYNYTPVVYIERAARLFKCERKLKTLALYDELAHEVAVMKRLKPSAGMPYNTPNFEKLTTALTYLQTEIKKDLDVQIVSGESDEQINASRTAHIARETIRLLYDFRMLAKANIEYGLIDELYRMRTMTEYDQRCYPALKYTRAAMFGAGALAFATMGSYFNPTSLYIDVRSCNMRALITRTVSGVLAAGLARESMRFFLFSRSEIDKGVKVVASEVAKLVQEDEERLIKKAGGVKIYKGMLGYSA